MRLIGKEIKHCHSQAELVMGWDMIDETAWQRNNAITHSLFKVMGWKTAWQLHKAVSLTTCWSWKEIWLMRLPCKEIKQCHSLSVGHQTWLMRLPGKDIKPQCHSHSVGEMRHDCWDYLGKKKAVSPTFCWSWDGMGLVRLPSKDRKQCHTFYWWDETWLMRLPGKEIKWCHSQLAGHGMRHYWWDCLAKK